MSFFEPPTTATPEPVETATGSWNRIMDFRGGIHADIASSRPPGHAQPDNTFQCYASPAGSLIPTPRLVGHITRPLSDFPSPDNLVSEQFRISGIYANAPVYASSPNNRNTTGPDECHTELWFGFEHWTGNPANLSNATMHLNVSRYSRNKTTPHWGTAWTRTYAGWEYNPIVRPRNCVFASQRSNVTDPMQSGPQIVAWVFSGNARYFPDDSNPTVSATGYMAYDQVDDTVRNPLQLIAPTYCIGHQGRMVVFPMYITGAGNAQVYISSEAAYWSPVNNAGELDPNLTHPFNILGGYEHAAGYGVFASLTADELFLVKIRGGGLFVSGDINTPTVRILSKVKSTGMAFNNGCNTSHGYLYPVDASGVWLWAGGDNSEHITKHLAPDFWRPRPVVPADTSTVQTDAGWGYGNTQSDSWNEFALFPANWMWDTDERGWWKILDPDIAEIHRWAADERGRLAWGTPSGFRTSSDPIAYEFDRLLGATYFSWQSHPMESTIDRVSRVSEVVVCAQGHGSIRVTATSAQDHHGAPPLSVTIDVDSDRPTLIRRNVNITGTGIVWRIESWGVDHDISAGSYDPAATTDAPTVHYLDYATAAASQLPAV